MTTQTNSPATAQFSFTILYTTQPRETIEFYERAFGLKRKFFVEQPGYGELQTGETTLVISNIAIEQGERGYPEASTPQNPAIGFHISFITNDVNALYAQTIAEGATPVKAPTAMAWGGTVAFVKDPNGITISLMKPRV
jgi:lactoylglutathione lyase